MSDQSVARNDNFALNYLWVFFFIIYYNEMINFISWSKQFTFQTEKMNAKYNFT